MHVSQYESEKSLADFSKQLQNKTILVYVKMYNRLFPCNQVDGPEKRSQLSLSSSRINSYLRALCPQ